MTTFSINNFISEVNSRGGVYRPTLFLFELDLPKWALTTNSEDVVASSESGNSEDDVKSTSRGIDSIRQTIPLLCGDCNLPGVTIAPIDVRRQGFGPMDRRPSTITFPDITASFLLDEDGAILQFFQTWLNNVQHFNLSKGEFGVVRDAYPFETYYRDNYLSPKVTITTFAATGQVIHQQTFHEAWPFQLGDVTLNYATTDTYAMLQVGFYYRTWSSVTASGQGITTPIPENKGRSLSTTEKILQTLTAGVAAFSAIKKPNHVGDYINATRNLLTLKNTAIGGSTRLPI